jgi:hypothetical protein
MAQGTRLRSYWRIGMAYALKFLCYESTIRSGSKFGQTIESGQG